jgi:TonB family protein
LRSVISRWAKNIGVSAALLAASPALAQKQPPRPDGGNVTPPSVLEHVDAVYPPGKLQQGVDTTVEVLITVERDGTVSGAKIGTSGGADFDAAALTAIRRWRFSPATRDGKPLRASISVPFHFAPDPHPPVAPGEPAAVPHPYTHEGTEVSPPLSAERPRPPAAKPKAGEYAPEELPSGLALPHAVAEPGKPIEVHVEGRPNPPRRGVSDFRIDRTIMDAAPRPTAADILKSVPGLHVMRPEGEAVAQRVYLRGFDADHGQDIQFSLGGTVPLNQPSHIHGQGYADLNVIIPETVRSVRVLEGVYDPHQGDFSVAGSVDFDLGVEERGVRTTGSYGSFDTKRLVAVWAPPGQSEETFGAAVVRTTDGFGEDVRGAVSGGAVGQYRFELPGDVSGLVHASAYGARSNVAGVLRRDDIDAGGVDFYGAYPDPTARSQSAAATRSQVAFTLQRTGDDGSESSIGVWGAYATYRSRLNFTGYTQRAQTRPAWVGRGDLIEQSNNDGGAGARAGFRTRRYEILPWLKAQLTLGGDVEAHAIEQAQNLLEAPQNETWDKRVDATVRSLRVGAYVDGLLVLSRWARLRGGVRADFMAFDIDDRLGNFTPSYREETHFVGFRRTAAGVAWGPRATVEVDPLRVLRLFASYGQGYRSPQARQLDEAEQAPFAKVHSYEVGARWTYAPARITASLAAYQTRLSYDLAFDADEGRLERIGPTTRTGVVVNLATGPIAGLTTGLSATFVRATLDAPPPATADNPSPPYVEGQSLPFVPPVVVRADTSYKRQIVSLLGKPLVGRAGFGATFLSPRPLPYSQQAQAVFVVDASLGIRRDFIEIGLDATNLLSSRYADTEYSFVSQWNTSEAPSLLPARHLSAGPPLTILGNLTFFL